MSRSLFTYICFLTICLVANAQYPLRKLKTQESGVFSESFFVLASDTTIRDGLYEMSYHNHVIESGVYSQGKKKGVWTYYNYRRMVELKYDYTLGQPVYILQHIGKEYDQNNYPAMFLGSPIVPYSFIMSHIYYPVAEQDRKGGGKVVLVLRINGSGKMTSYYIKESTSVHFTNVVRKAAEQMPKDEWQWVPAMKKGKPAGGEYNIVVMFDN